MDPKECRPTEATPAPESTSAVNSDAQRPSESRPASLAVAARCREFVAQSEAALRELTRVAVRVDATRLDGGGWVLDINRAQWIREHGTEDKAAPRS